MIKSNIPSEYVGCAKQIFFKSSIFILFCIAITIVWISEEASFDTICAPFMNPSFVIIFIKPSVASSHQAFPSAVTGNLATL